MINDAALIDKMTKVWRKARWGHGAVPLNHVQDKFDRDCMAQVLAAYRQHMGEGS